MGKSRQSADLVSDNNIFVDTTTDRVGIGTAIPQYDLDVAGDINFTGTFRQNGTQFVASRWTAGTGNDIYRLNGNIGIGTTNPAAVLDVRGNPWFRPNQSGAKATALRLGRFSDSETAAYDIVTDDAVGDTIEIQSNRYAGALQFSRSSPSGIQTTFVLLSNYISGTSISIADTTGTATKIQLSESGNSYFNNSGAILVGTSSSTGTASQKLQVTGGAYVSDNIGVGTINPSTKLDVLGIGQFNANGATLNLVGSDHTYIQFYPDGVAAGRKGYLGYPAATTDDLRIVNQISGANIELLPTSGSVLVNSSTRTGTASQPLQVTGGAYVSGNLGIGVTNPSTYKLDVSGPTKINHTGTEQLTVQGSGGGYFFAGYDNANNRARIGSYKTGWTDLLLNEGGNVILGSTSATGTASQPLQVTGGAYVSGSVGIGTTNPQYKLHVVGSFGATTKSFIIDHPTKEGKKLQYGSLEGPELGVYVRGRTQSSVIELPEYWTELVDENSITVNLTPIGKNPGVHSVIDILDNTIIIESTSDTINCFFTIFAERKDVDKLIVEY